VSGASFQKEKKDKFAKGRSEGVIVGTVPNSPSKTRERLVKLILLSDLTFGREEREN